MGVEILTASLDDEHKNIVQKKIGDALGEDRRQLVKEEQAAIARGEDCELERMFKEKMKMEEPSHATPEEMLQATPQGTQEAAIIEQRAKAKVEQAAAEARREAAEEAARRSLQKVSAGVPAVQIPGDSTAEEETVDA